MKFSNLKFFKRFRKTKIIILSLLFVLLVYIVWLKIPTASNDRDWAVDQMVLDGRAPAGQLVGAQPGLETVRTHGAEEHRQRPGD